PASPPAGDPAPSSAGPGAQPGAGQASAPKEPETSGLLDCDPGKIMCRRMAPACPQGQVPSVSGSCYGPCVAIERCACSAAAQCPQPDQHTCWREQHCGPFVR
ncbi:MAG TPA: hypothetical protein PKU97_20530, partial [Kofleriaceae bacterium]|nr:hypothetical protein [Kofleriaceae bacterium]